MTGEKRIIRGGIGVLRILRILLWALLMTALSGCASGEGEENANVQIEREEEFVAYTLATVQREDVVLTAKIRCVYEQLNSMDMSFMQGGKLVSRVWVKEGDSVVKGQLLAELESGNYEEEIRDLEYRIARNQLLADHAEINENYEISEKWLNYLYKSKLTDKEKEVLEAAVEDILQNYRYLKEDYADAIGLDLLQLERLRKEEEMSRIYAGMSGRISFLQSGLEGATSLKGATVITIIDNTECLFAATDLSYIDCFKEGDTVEMSITSGSGMGKYQLYPYQIEKWEDTLWFALSDAYEDVVIEVGATGTISFALESRSQVLTLPAAAIHKADGREYVYIINGDNLREVNWIETGLWGDGSVEILSGLEEGEKVILK